MTFSTFELFKIGVGPSSSHTMGPMVAAANFAEHASTVLGVVGISRYEVRLYGSLALTGKGHATDRAVILGLLGCRPDTICPDQADAMLAKVRADKSLSSMGGVTIGFDEARDLLFLQRERLPFHSNAMRFSAFGAAEQPALTQVWYSIGGGAVLAEDEIAEQATGPQLRNDLPYPYHSGAELLETARRHNLSIAQLMLANELQRHSAAEVEARLDAIIDTMFGCIERGIRQDGILPGGLNVKRRAVRLHRQLVDRQERLLADPLAVLDWVNLWALAVNEENAAGGRVVTAPTNGAAGIVPAVLRFYERFTHGADRAGMHRFLLAAAAIGSLFKENASISGAEVGCQGEVGVACAMAAAGLAAAQGGSNEQVENAAEIGMEHNLGLTCDPVAGLVQVPCIERNAVGAVKAIEAARLAMIGDGTHRVSLDQVIETMRRTGADMSERYKETSLGGLAVNVVEC